MTDEELKKLVEQEKRIAGSSASNTEVLAALINAKAIRDATYLIANKLDTIATKIELI